MAELKTKKNNLSVDEFLNSVADEQKRQDCFTVLNLMRDVTGEEPAMWGSSMVGFGSYHYKYASGTEGDWFVAGFSPRKQYLTLYIMSGFARHDEIMKRLGKHTTGKGCLYLKKLADIEIPVLKELIQASVEAVSQSNA